MKHKSQQWPAYLHQNFLEDAMIAILMCFTSTGTLKAAKARRFLCHVLATKSAW